MTKDQKMNIEDVVRADPDVAESQQPKDTAGNKTGLLEKVKKMIQKLKREEPNIYPHF